MDAHVGPSWELILATSGLVAGLVALAFLFGPYSVFCPPLLLTGPGLLFYLGARLGHRFDRDQELNGVD